MIVISNFMFKLMPQMDNFLLELQFNSTVVLIALTIIGLAKFVLPLLARLLMARTHLSV
jgi:hypothetical protein